jgi:nucleoside-diphosphate-sugar epimerase
MDELMTIRTIHQTTTPLGTTPGVFLARLIDSPDRSGALVGDTGDVRDVADLHISALEHQDIGGERVLIRSSEYSVHTYS